MKSKAKEPAILQMHTFSMRKWKNMGFFLFCRLCWRFKDCIRNPVWDKGLKGGKMFLFGLWFFHSCCPNLTLRGLKCIFLSFQELVRLSIHQTKRCIPARFVVSSCNCVSIKTQPIKLTWNKAPLGRGQIQMPSVTPWKKNELAGLLPGDWVWLKRSQQL